MTNFIKRALTGAIYVALIVCSLLFGGDWAFPPLCCLFSAGALCEFYRIGNTDKEQPVTLSLDLAIGVLITAIPLMIFYLPNGIPTAIMFVPVAFVVRCVTQIYSRESSPLDNLAFSFAGLVYIALPMAMVSVMSIWMSPMVVLALFIMLWLNDTGAYLVGSAIGRHRLIERISPKKSWEGFWGGLLFTAAGAAAMTPWITGQPEYTVSRVILCAVIGVIISVTATWGDLIESLVKRARGVKDAGNILPGHGGILDRIASLLLAGPTMLALKLLSYISY